MSWERTVRVTGYRMDDWKVEVKPQLGKEFFLFQVVQTSSGAKPASYAMGIGGSFPRSRSARMWSWPLNSNYYRGQENICLYIRPPLPSGVMANYLRTGTTITLPLWVTILDRSKH
jgi:hypothetical protein